MAQRRRSGYDEDWQRRKAELIRSFFTELRPLSPVPEEEESFATSASPQPLQAPAIRPHDTEESGGRYSPLPPLIIEIVLKPNKHDDPPEHYVQLEKRVMKAYRRLFIEGYSDISELSDSDSSDSNQIEDVGRRVKRASFVRDTEPTVAVQELIKQTICGDDTLTFENQAERVGRSVRRASFGEPNEIHEREAEPDEVLQEFTKQTSFYEVTQTLESRAEHVGRSVRRASFGEPTETHERDKEPSEVLQKLTKQTSFDDATQTFERDKDKSLEDTEPEMDEDLSLEDKPIRKNDRLSESDKETLVVEEMATNPSTEIIPQSTSDEGDFEESRLSSTISLETESSTLMEGELVNEDSGKTSLSSANISYTQITFQADVHRDAMIEEIIIPSLVYVEENVDQEPAPKAIIEEMNVEANVGEVEESRIPAIDINTTADVEEPREVEVMRTPRIHVSAGSLQNEPYDESHGETVIVEQRSRSLEAHPETDLVEGESPHNVVMELEESIDYDVLRISSPVLEQNENIAPENVSPDKRKSSEVSASSTPSKRKRRQDMGTQTPQDEDTQTHFDEEDVNMRILRDKQFFSEVMGVYRLCACANHLCSR